MGSIQTWLTLWLHNSILEKWVCESPQNVHEDVPRSFIHNRLPPEPTRVSFNQGMVDACSYIPYGNKKNFWYIDEFHKHDDDQNTRCQRLNFPRMELSNMYSFVSPSWIIPFIGSSNTGTTNWWGRKLEMVISGGLEEYWLPEGMRELPKDTKNILYVQDTHVNICQVVHLRFMHFTVCMWYLCWNLFLKDQVKSRPIGCGQGPRQSVTSYPGTKHCCPVHRRTR